MTDDCKKTMRDVRHEPRADGVSSATVWERGPDAADDASASADD
ncbi:MAG: hypothetical protein ABEJ79_08945 [Halolamina sp.]